MRRDLFEKQVLASREALDRRAQLRDERMKELASAVVAVDVSSLPASLHPNAQLALTGLVEHLEIGRDGRRPVFSDITDQLRDRLEDWGLEPDMSLDELIGVIEECEFGFDLWMSPQRAMARRYRSMIYARTGGTMRRAAVAEASTAWSAITAAFVAALDEGANDWK